MSDQNQSVTEITTVSTWDGDNWVPVEMVARTLVYGEADESVINEKGPDVKRPRNGASMIRFHLQRFDMDADDRDDLAALADSLDTTDDDRMAVYRFARDFARQSAHTRGSDGPLCNCVPCRAWRAVRDDEGYL